MKYIAVSSGGNCIRVGHKEPPVYTLDLQHQHPRAAAASSPGVHRPFRLCEWRCAHQRSSAASSSLLGQHHRDRLQRLHRQRVQCR